MSKKPTAGEDFAAAVRQARARRKATREAASIAAGALTFRAFLSSPDYFSVAYDISPALWAIVDASDGRPDLIDAALCRTLFNCDPSGMPTEPPRIVGIEAGRRCGKTSRLLAPKAVHMAWTVKLPNLLKGEIARVAVVAPDLDTAMATMNYVKGIIGSSDVLRGSVVGNSGDEDEDIGTVGRVVLKRPDGKLVDIVVRAASRGGKTVRSRTLAGLIMDEACFLYADDGHTVTDRAIFDAAMPALEPGAQAWLASTPWIEGEGLLEEIIAENWKHGTQGKTGIAAARVGTRLLRPTWDLDHSIENALRAGADGNATTDREICAIPHPAGSRRFFLPIDVDAAMALAAPVDVQPVAFGAGADYGHTSDPSALATTRRYPGGMFSCSLVMVLPSSQDRKPSETYATFARAALGRGANAIASDVHSKENAREEYQRHGVDFAASAPTEAMFSAGRDVMRERRLHLGSLPEVDKEMLRRQFTSVLAVPVAGGQTKIVLPRTSVKDAAQGKGTTHCDALVALFAGLYQVGSGSPALWANDTERREKAKVATEAARNWTPEPGSKAALDTLRNKGGRPWGQQSDRGW